MPQPIAWKAPVLPVGDHAGASLKGYPFGKTASGYAVWNPVHQLRFEFTATGLSVSSPDRDWQFGYRLEAVGRGQSPSPVIPATPAIAACAPGAACDWRLQYHRGPVVEWYLNTVQGLQQGFDLATRPLGNGPLIVTGRFQSRLLTSTLEDDGRTVAWRFEGVTAFTYARILVLDADGLTVPSQLELDGDALRIVIDDSKARYPLVIDPDVGTCPSSWCSDGDRATIDICTDDGDTCTNLFDETFEGAPCVFGQSCCADGKFHADCTSPDVPTGQPRPGRLVQRR